MKNYKDTHKKALDQEGAQGKENLPINYTVSITNY